MRWSVIAVVLLVVTIASLALNVYQYSSPKSVTVTAVNLGTATCVRVEGQENPLVTFRILVNYSGPWVALVTGYNPTSANPPILLSQCYLGDGSGYILVQDWNPNGQASLNATIQKVDASHGNLTAIFSGIFRSTTAPLRFRDCLRDCCSVKTSVVFESPPSTLT